MVERSTEYLHEFSGVMHINYQKSSLQSKMDEWSVLFRTIPLQDIPREFHDCLSIHKIQTVSIGIAGAFGPPHHLHRPFFGLPLLDTISLPIHLHCTFILSDDRRSIRYDDKGKGNTESKFNKWLLTEKVPSFYFQFLAGWDRTRKMEDCPWWPKRAEDTISKAVVMGVEAMLPTSNQLVCDTYSGHRIAPSEAYFPQLCPKGLLLKLCPDDLAVVPMFPYLSSPPLQNVDSKYLTAVLRQETTSIISLYKKGTVTVEDIVDIAKFLQLTFPDSLGLPLLPLADGTLASLSTEHTTFYCPPRQHENPWLPFSPHYFLDPRATKEHKIYDVFLVQKLENSAISRLILSTTQIPEEDSFSSSPAQERWLEELWDLLEAIPGVEIKDPAFERLPLIPTYNPGTPTRISFQNLASSEVLFIKRPADVPLNACVTLGMKPIKSRDCGGRLKEAIESRKEWHPDIYRAVIDFFARLSSGETLDRFQRLDRELHSEFSLWFRERLRGGYLSLSDTEKTIVKDLPLWETVQIDLRTARFVSANAAVAIPEGINPEVVRTWATGTEYIHGDYLLSLMKDPIPPPTFYTDHLSFPYLMTPTPVYKSLLEEVLRSPQRTSSIRVPNADGRMASSSELYLSSNTTFANAFASQNGSFLHPGLRYLEQQLCSWGLINTITADSFEACARAIHQDCGRGDIRARGLVVFRTYDAEMPPKLLGAHGSQNALRNLRFIPRRLGSTRYGSIPTDRYHALPNIVSPSEILDPDFVSVAWTQRAVCHEEPSAELQLVNKSIWEPEVSEVVRSLFVCFPLFTSHSFSQIEHLRVLSTKIAPDLGSNPGLIEDLKATYSWLDRHESEASRLLDYKEERLFLNVDNASSEWSWNSASGLLFDENDSSNPRRVRQFLRNYQGLLRAAGVREISHVSIPNNLLGEDSYETQLERLRGSFDEMRKADQLTDVIFIAEDGAEFTAHRAFLAAQIGHFKTCFSHGWRESDIIGNKARIPLDKSRECIEAVLGA